MDGSGCHPALGPERPELADASIGESVAPRDVGAEQFELRHPVPGAKAQVDVPVAHEIDHGDLLGDLGRRVQRREQHCSADPHPRRSRRDRGREGERLRQVAVVEQVVLGEPHRVGAEPFGLLAELEGVPVEAGRVLAPAWRVPEVEVHADVHAAESCTSRPPVFY